MVKRKQQKVVTKEETITQEQGELINKQQLMALLARWNAVVNETNFPLQVYEKFAEILTKQIADQRLREMILQEITKIEVIRKNNGGEIFKIEEVKQ